LSSPSFPDIADNANQSFHNCHNALKTASIQQASSYLSQLLDDIEYNSSNDLYAYAIFLQAKISQLKGSSEEAIKYYQQYLSYKPVDPTLNYNAYTSMATIFYARQDLLAVSKVLDDLHGELSFQKKSC
jgi:tetratricopeptide (TPR) repeat protein